MEQALAGLHAHEREVLYLHAVDGDTAKELAVLTGKPRGTALSLLHRAKEKLRQSLSPKASNPLGVPRPIRGPALTQHLRFMHGFYAWRPSWRRLLDA